MMFPWELEVTPAPALSRLSSRRLLDARKLGTSGTEDGTAFETTSIHYETADTGLSIVRRCDIARLVGNIWTSIDWQ